MSPVTISSTTSSHLGPPLKLECIQDRESLDLCALERLISLKFQPRVGKKQRNFKALP